LSSDVLELLTGLVKVPSVCGEEAKIAEYIAEWLEKNRLPVELLRVAADRSDVITRLKAPESGPRVLLNGHMDTVDPGQGWTHDPFGAEVEEGRMYGRGALDMKSGLACILWTAALCRQENLPRRGELVVTVVVDEEAISRGTHALVKNGITKGMSLAMIAEATDLNVVTAHCGRAVFEVEVHGQATHSESPERGVNAIEKAALIVNALPKVSGRHHPKIGSTAFNTLKIEGGQEEVMLVPDRCRLILDRCLVPGYTSEEVLEDLKHLATEMNIDADVRLKVRETPFSEPFEIADGDPQVQLVVDAATEVLGKTPNLGFHNGPCDSTILVNVGKVPTIEFGPCGSGLHEADEYVELESVKKTATVYHEIMRRLLS
jgi:acetylornithine deacetylase/succinyl-diaminopimelate desuccinylase family protein